jgi:hypothetical protein
MGGNYFIDKDTNSVNGVGFWDVKKNRGILILLVGY